MALNWSEEDMRRKRWEEESKERREGVEVTTRQSKINRDVGELRVGVGETMKSLCAFVVAVGPSTKMGDIWRHSRYSSQLECLPSCLHCGASTLRCTRIITRLWYQNVAGRSCIVNS